MKCAVRINGFPHRFGLCILGWLLLALVSASTPLTPIVPPNNKEAQLTGLGVDTLYALPDQWILSESVEVWVDSVLWQSGVHYWYSEPDHRLRFYRILEPAEVVTVRYRLIPLDIKESYTHRQLSDVAVVTDSGTIERPTLPSDLSQRPTAGLGAKLRRSGSLVRGITVGTGRSGPDPSR